MVDFTDWAEEILRKADEASRRLNPDARIRLARAPGGMEAKLVDAAMPGDETVSLEGIALYVEEGLEGLVDVEEPHDRLVLRPHGSTPNVREP